MYTQVTFGLFLETLLARLKGEQGIEFGDEYPNPAIPRYQGDWLYEIVGGFSVRVFRWGLDREVEVAGPNWNNLSETQQEFEARFTKDFFQAIAELEG
jgi:hypothetical protein